ncbi:helix-turn-helix transcriptional regulator [Streptomyces sp. KM273126]|uniref:helix-turn-helix domain-containing protein n=1 Tax=Streptomyces sp. KM273126 TaxID=2545247 RepID=UPI00103D49F5|nr:helix-turn-helix transcriptional regulator [Streptomyces sp. KM273126]MBA2807214.1 helix-turn-helix transcriptional regulator [Streptomyces sp. KM273126]
MASLNVGNLGEYLREQRRNAQLSLRQLAAAAGVSNPYLSQIERGLRKPSAEVLQQVAKALRISAETLYVRAGILDAERDGEEGRRDGATRAVILDDPTLNERQKQVLLQIYESFRKENGFEVAGSADDDGLGDVQEQGVRDQGVQGHGVQGVQGAQDVTDVMGVTGVRGEIRAVQDTERPGPRTADGGDAGSQQTAS